VSARPCERPGGSPEHRTVLLTEAVAGLAIEGGRADGIYVDGTFGRGGHSRAILDRLGAAGRLLALDRDLEAVRAAKEITDRRFSLRHARFSEIGDVLGEVLGGSEAVVDGVLLDIGVSSPQIDVGERGFSFRQDGPLDMRMDTTRGETAAEWLERASERDITEVIRNYGEERFAFQIAKKIVSARQQQRIERTEQLAAIVASAVRTREPGQDPATRCFQALRIHVNQELEELQLVLPKAFAALRPGGRLVVISFHSLEDRVVKNFMREQSNSREPPKGVPIRAADLPPPAARLIGRALRPSTAETAENPRARSATMRVLEKA
jgi:16S rRNA (cytosine1402-N4)-methyltransferase